MKVCFRNKLTDNVVDMCEMLLLRTLNFFKPCIDVLNFCLAKKQISTHSLFKSNTFCDP